MYASKGITRIRVCTLAGKMIARYYTNNAYSKFVRDEVNMTEESVFRRLSSECRERAAQYSRTAALYLTLFLLAVILALGVFFSVPFFLQKQRAEDSVLRDQLDILRSEEKISRDAIGDLIAQDVDRLKGSWVHSDLTTLMTIYTGGFFSSSKSKGSSVIAGEDGFVAFSNDCGQTWSEQKSLVSVNLLDVAFLPGNFFGRALIVGRDGAILEVSDVDGGNIKLIDINEKRDIRDIYKVGRALFISGSEGLVRRSDGNTKVWRDISIGTKSTIYDMAFGEAGLIVAVGSEGLISITKDQGATWKVVDHLLKKSLQDIKLISENRAIVTGLDGVIGILDIEQGKLVDRLNLTSERIIDIDLVDDQVILSGDGGFLAVGNLNDLDFSILKVPKVNLRQISVVDGFAYVPTKFGDLIALNLTTSEFEIQRTPARGNLSRVVSGKGLECAFVYGEDGQVLHPSRRYSEALSQVDDSDLGDVQRVYVEAMPEKIRSGTNYFQISQKMDVVKFAEIRIEAIEGIIERNSNENPAVLSNLSTILGYSALVPIFGLSLLIVDFTKRRSHFYESLSRQYVRSAHALELADASETHDGKIAMLSRLFESKDDLDPEDHSLKELLSLIKGSP